MYMTHLYPRLRQTCASPKEQAERSLSGECGGEGMKMECTYAGVTRGALDNRSAGSDQTFLIERSERGARASDTAGRAEARRAKRNLFLRRP